MSRGKQTLSFMKKVLFFGALVFCTLSLNSCATIFSGTKETVTFQTEPAGAEVKVVRKNGTEEVVGTTPCTVPISKKTTEVKFSKENYYSENYPIRTHAKINGWYYVDMVELLAGLVGLPSTIVDLSTGAIYNLPNQVSLELKKK